MARAAQQAGPTQPITLADFMKAIMGGGQPQTPLDQWQSTILPDGRTIYWDPSGNGRIMGEEDKILYRWDMTQGKIYRLDTEAGSVTDLSIPGWTPSPPKPLSPAQQATTARLGQEPGTIDWQAGFPTGQWLPGGGRESYRNDPEIQAGIIDQEITKLMAKRAELVRLSAPQFQTPGEPGEETASMQEEIAGVQREIAAVDSKLDVLRRARQSVGRLSREPGYVPGGGAAPRTEFPSEREEREARAALARAQTGAIPSEIASREAQVGYTGALRRKTEQEMLGKQQLAFQQYFDAIQALQDMMAKGTIKPAEADAYMSLFKQNFESSMRGTTPFDEEKLKTETTTQRGQIGRDVLNQRLQSGTSMANTLIGLLGSTAGKLAPLPGGQPLNFNPFAMAKSFTADIGGGPQVSSIAQQLLQGLIPQGSGVLQGPQGGMAPSPAAPGGTEGLPPDTPPELMELARQAKALAGGGA